MKEIVYLDALCYNSKCQNRTIADVLHLAKLGGTSV